MPPKQPSRNTSPTASSKKKPFGKPLAKSINENADGNAAIEQQQLGKGGKSAKTDPNDKPSSNLPVTPRLETSGTIAETAIQLLETQEETLLAMLLDALHQYATKNERKQTVLVELDVLPKLAPLFDNASRNVRRKAVRLFAMLAGIPAASTQLTRLPYIDALNKFVTCGSGNKRMMVDSTAATPGGGVDNDLIMRLYATHMYAALCSHPHLVAQIVDNVGVECLMDKLNDIVSLEIPH